MIRGVLAAIALVAAVVVAPVAAQADAADGKESCWIAASENILPPGANPTERCHDFFSELTTTPIDGGITISWVPASTHATWYCGPSGALQDCPVNEYRIETPIWDGSGTLKTGRCSVGPSERSCTITGLTNGRNHQLAVNTYLANGNFFRLYLVETPCCDLPAPPTDVQAGIGATYLDASWQAPNRWSGWGGSTTLEFEASTIPAQASCRTTALACRLEGLTPGTSY